MMIERKIISDIKKKVKESDETREKIIAISRKILKNSKKAIYAVHRKDTDSAAKLIESAEKDIGTVEKTISGYSKLEFSGSYYAALQEYVEAKSYLAFVLGKPLPGFSRLAVSVDNYLLGICDLAGELERMAVNSAMERDFSQVYKVRDFLDELMGLFLELNLTNGELRKKSDSIKWMLKKVEGIIYDIKTKGLMEEP
jgi:predicted translin family RNA/ssDNA-binding protein